MYEGKTQLTRIWVYKAEYAHKMEENMEENIEAHTKWMQRRITEKVIKRYMF